MLPPGYYEPGPNGTFNVGTPAGVLPMALTPEQLADAGLQPYDPTQQPLPMAGGGGGGASPSPFSLNVTTTGTAPSPGAVQGLPPIVGATADVPPAAPGPARPLISAAPAAPAGPPQPTAEGPSRASEIDEITQRAVKSRLRGGGPVRTIPEHQQETTGKVKRQAGPSPEAEAAVSDAELNYQLWKQQQAEATGSAMEQAGYQRTGEAEQARYQLEMDQYRRSLIDQDIEAKQKDIADREERVAQMASQPQSYLQSHGALASAAVVIGTALGAAGAMLGHGHNDSLDIMNKAVDDEYRAQESAIAHAKNGIEAKRWALGEFIAAHGDPRTAELEFKLRAKDLITQMAEAEALKSGAPGVMAAFQDWKAERDLQRAKEVAALDAQVRGEVEQNWKTIPQQRTGGGGDLLSALRYGGQVREAAQKAFGVLGTEEQAKLNLEQRKVEGQYGVPGAVNAATTPHERELGMTTPSKRGSPVGAAINKANEQQTLTSQAMALADSYEKANIHANENYASWEATKHANKITNEAAAMFAKANIGSSDQMAQEEAHRHLPVAGNPLFGGGLTSKTTVREAAKAMREQALDKYNSTRTTLGLPPVTEAEFKANYMHGAQAGGRAGAPVKTFQPDEGEGEKAEE